MLQSWTRRRLCLLCKISEVDSSVNVLRKLMLPIFSYGLFSSKQYFKCHTLPNQAVYRHVAAVILDNSFTQRQPNSCSRLGYREPLEHLESLFCIFLVKSCTVVSERKPKEVPGFLASDILSDIFIRCVLTADFDQQELGSKLRIKHLTNISLLIAHPSDSSSELFCHLFDTEESFFSLCRGEAVHVKKFSCQ
ncbi:hypothetical protein CLV94_0653 [Flavobacterium endophyticum]|uniref:Uncharacterized protein n=1 Tax=Flavobacterium endophyticum TaxID=1540163 RepID=A0A495MJT2_9FLAO|nr:hypothetical protein CLV94_0653 [Flavobacterium endophyticum]